MFSRRFVLFSTLLAFQATACLLFPRFPALAQEHRIEVLPIIFVPSDNTAILAKNQIEPVKSKLLKHVVLARAHYRALLGTDTFVISDREVVVFEAPRPASAYTGQKAKGEADAAHVMLKDLLGWDRKDRYNSSTVYLAVYAPPANSRGTGGGGRPINGSGRPNSGGGFVHVDLSSLLDDERGFFQSTLVHELGHAFGLTHTDCHGYDMQKSDSIMGYNPLHHSKGVTLSEGAFAPEEYFILSLNKRAFPAFVYIPAKHNPDKKKFTTIDGCFFGPMDDSIGPFRRISGVGYELLLDGKVISGPETAFWSARDAKRHCASYKKNASPSAKIECHYDGGRLGYELVWDGKVVSGPETELWSREQAQGNCTQNKRNRPGLRTDCRYNGRPLQDE
jgi:hypothetical protein